MVLKAISKGKGNGRQLGAPVIYHGRPEASAEDPLYCFNCIVFHNFNYFVDDLQYDALTSIFSSRSGFIQEMNEEGFFHNPAKLRV